ncbi:hypothetical protein [Micromonospora sp. NPDC050200]|uniref:hypothetical protein n=1 Tax=Micromonospora sp. NPDC050200 TaxID=3155664 RepID=UPI0033F59185
MRAPINIEYFGGVGAGFQGRRSKMLGVYSSAARATIRPAEPTVACGATRTASQMAETVDG